MPSAARLWARKVALVSVMCPNSNSVPHDKISARICPPTLRPGRSHRSCKIGNGFRSSLQIVSIIIPHQAAKSIYCVASIKKSNILCQGLEIRSFSEYTELRKVKEPQATPMLILFDILFQQLLYFLKRGVIKDVRTAVTYHRRPGRHQYTALY